MSDNFHVCAYQDNEERGIKDGRKRGGLANGEASIALLTWQRDGDRAAPAATARGTQRRVACTHSTVHERQWR